MNSSAIFESANCLQFYTILFIVAPAPRPPTKAEKTYRVIESDGTVSSAKQLPCWQDIWKAEKQAARETGDFSNKDIAIEKPELYMSVVVPAYNEEDRLSAMLSEAVEYLEKEYGTGRTKQMNGNGSMTNGHAKGSNGTINGNENGHANHAASKDWEILIVSDGSTDKTIETALRFAQKLGSPAAHQIRVVALSENRGKGGAVVHGMRHVRGRYAVFADADGASKFEDLGKLVHACQEVQDTQGRALAIGSRAHLVGSEAVIKVRASVAFGSSSNDEQRSFLRNFLMHSFHLFLRLLTPPATAAIRDTQCGFKLFSRSSLPYIVPYMHSEGWIFDVEMLMLAELADIPVAEVPVGWHEVNGSKLNVIWDSLGMAWGLAILRAAWGLGVYRRS